MDAEEELIIGISNLCVSDEKINRRQIIIEEDDIDINCLYTKEKRQEAFGKCSGGKNTINIENFQREKIEEGTGIKCKKTKTRINLRTNEIKDIPMPNRNKDGFDYSENFDGIQIYQENKFYINLKNVVGKGGSQTRTLREVYWFIQGQLNVLLRLNEGEHIFFANVLDGDSANSCMKHFQYLTDLEEYKDVKEKIFIGNLTEYIKWFHKNK
jgi:hypothetical protein